MIPCFSLLECEVNLLGLKSQAIDQQVGTAVVELFLEKLAQSTFSQARHMSEASGVNPHEFHKCFRSFRALFWKLKAQY